MRCYISFKICFLIDSLQSSARGKAPVTKMHVYTQGGGERERKKESFKRLVKQQLKWARRPKIADCFIESLLYAHLFLSWNSFQFWLSDVTNRCISNRLQLSVSLPNGGQRLVRMCAQTQAAAFIYFSFFNVFHSAKGSGWSCAISAWTRNKRCRLMIATYVHKAVSHPHRKAGGFLSVS